MTTFEERRQNAIEYKLKVEDYDVFNIRPEWDDPEIYGETAIMHIIMDDDIPRNEAILRFDADWFLHPHVMGRTHEGESDFAAIRLVNALYNESCYSKLSEETNNAIKHFFIDNNYFSEYHSENHYLMSRVARYLAAQKFPNEYFRGYGKIGSELIEDDKAYISEFITFRAKRNWGEFNSLGYSYEIMLVLNTLYAYTQDALLKEKARKMMDLILLDMSANSLDCLYSGAHGRSYPNSVLDRYESEIIRLYLYYFGGEYYKPDLHIGAIFILSDYVPSGVVYKAIASKPKAWENKERVHLHACTLWDKIDYSVLDRVDGYISKYTYVCEDYAIGSIHKQDAYPTWCCDEDRGYAKHQQHEWELVLAGNTKLTLFTHHVGEEDYHHINNRWTGDNRCLCGSFYTNKNTAIAMYNIDPKNHTNIINAHVELDLFDEKIIEDKYLFLSRDKLFISFYFDNGYSVNDRDEFAGRELESFGYQNAVVVRVAYASEYDSLLDFAKAIKGMSVNFDREEKTVSFENIVLRTDGNMVNGVESQYPYANTFDCPFLKSKWDSGVIDIILDDEVVTYDFN